MAKGKKSRDRNASGNLAKPPEINKIKLNDGKEYDLAPLNINMMAELEDKFDKPLHKVLDNRTIKPMRYLLWLRLKEKYPEIDSEEKLGSMLDLDVINNLSEILGID